MAHARPPSDTQEEHCPPRPAWSQGQGHTHALTVAGAREAVRHCAESGERGTRPGAEGRRRARQKAEVGGRGDTPGEMACVIPISTRPPAPRSLPRPPRRALPHPWQPSLVLRLGPCTPSPGPSLWCSTSPDYPHLGSLPFLWPWGQPAGILPTPTQDRPPGPAVPQDLPPT